jgi:hypothetical protein
VITRATEVEAAKDPLAIYSAVIESLPTSNAFVVSAATPELFKGAVPRAAVPLKKVTEPPVTGEPEPDTEAVRVTFVPDVNVVADAVNAVVVGTCVTAIETAGEVEVAKLVVPA